LCGAQLKSTGTTLPFPGGKEAGAWGWPLTSIPPIRLHGVVFC